MSTFLGYLVVIIVGIPVVVIGLGCLVVVGAIFLLPIIALLVGAFSLL